MIVPTTKTGGTLPTIRRRRRIVGAVALLFLILLVAGISWPEKFLLVEQPPAKADAIVLLGGGITFRVPCALELYRDGLAPVIVITGNGDAEEVRRWLLGNGVPTEAMRCEADSANTWQNAKLTVPILRERQAHRVILVTSWFHSRRALACFRKAAPEIEFLSVPTVADRPEVHTLDKKEWGRVLYEYVKLVGYGVRYGVNPF